MTWIRAEGSIGKPTIYYDEKGPAIAVYGSRNRRNNNPGNIEYGPFAHKHGAIGTDGRFAIFPDEETGFRAMKDLLLSNSYKNLTIRDAIKKWAPAPENDPQKYLEFVIQKTGLDENELIKNLTPSQLDALTKAMAAKEGYYSSKLKIVPLRDDVDPSTFLKNNKDFEEVRSLNDIAPHNPSYIVQPGDTLSKIAKRYGVDLNDLINENRRRGLIKDPNLIYPGQRIYIPGYQEKVRRNVQEGSRRIDPLVIDLDGDGIKLVNINKSNAMFDLTGFGFANKTGWISSGDAFLVWDKNNNGRIDDISEMFGSGNQSGFKALALYDTNRDGRIDAFDDVFKNLKLWQDRNGDGRTDEGELLSLRLGTKIA
jgi:LysM repeat protein